MCMSKISHIFSNSSHFAGLLKTTKNYVNSSSRPIRLCLSKSKSKKQGLQHSISSSRKQGNICFQRKSKVPKLKKWFKLSDSRGLQVVASSCNNRQTWQMCATRCIPRCTTRWEMYCYISLLPQLTNKWKRFLYSSRILSAYLRSRKRGGKLTQQWPRLSHKRWWMNRLLTKDTSS